MTFNSKSLIWLSVVVLIITVTLRFAERNYLIDGSTGTRAFMVFLGLAVAAFGNSVPKQLKRLRASAEAEQRTQTALRTVGWTVTTAGLLLCGIWVAAPDAIARIVSLFALGIAFLVTVVASLACRHASRMATIR
jgi:hypothetical protein